MCSNMKIVYTVLGLACFLQWSAAKGKPELDNNVPIHRSKSGNEDWGYVSVRPEALMFWWLYYSTAVPYTSVPLVLWLQGGPGASSCGFGNFEEIGPLNVDLTPRNTTWVSSANVLFIDNPVGTGYSFVTNMSALTTNNLQIANDLVTLITAFFTKLTKFQDIPFYVFSESYGGKMTADFSNALLKAIDAGTVSCKFKGFTMGDSWISPIDSVLTWGPYLYATSYTARADPEGRFNLFAKSLLESYGLKAVNTSAMKTKEAFDAGKYLNSTNLWGATEDVIDKYTNGVNFYNILKTNSEDLTRNKVLQKNTFISKLFHRHVQPYQADDLSALMNGPIKKKLGIPDNVTWGGQSEAVFTALKEDFMKPVINVVDNLICNSSLSVIVYNGQLDLIVDTLGTEAWVKKLTWPGLKHYNNMTWTPLYVSSRPDQTSAFVKTYENFSFYWILDAGHMIPLDAGDMALKMMKMITGSK